jgi:16S rRNA (guanine1207-N2)-methyltransferase
MTSSSSRSFELPVGDRRLTFRTQPGVFSQDGPDDGSLLLLDAVLPRVKPHNTVLDLGTGVGLLGLSVAGLLTRGEVWMVDSDIRAVRLAQQNIELNQIKNAHVVLGDITEDLPEHLRFDLVLSNPPTHSGKEVLARFVDESFRVLRPGGSLYLVVNRLLSVRDMMARTFGEAEQVQRHKGFIVLQAQKPRRQRQ